MAQISHTRVNTAASQAVTSSTTSLKATQTAGWPSRYFPNVYRNAGDLATLVEINYESAHKPLPSSETIYTPTPTTTNKASEADLLSPVSSKPGERIDLPEGDPVADNPQHVQTETQKQIARSSPPVVTLSNGTCTIRYQIASDLEICPILNTYIPSSHADPWALFNAASIPACVMSELATAFYGDQHCYHDAQFAILDSCLDSARQCLLAAGYVDVEESYAHKLWLTEEQREKKQLCWGGHRLARPEDVGCLDGIAYAVVLSPATAFWHIDLSGDLYEANTILIENPPLQIRIPKFIVFIEALIETICTRWMEPQTFPKVTRHMQVAYGMLKRKLDENPQSIQLLRPENQFFKTFFCIWRLPNRRLLKVVKLRNKIVSGKLTLERAEELVPRGNPKVLEWDRKQREEATRRFISANNIRRDKWDLRT